MTSGSDKPKRMLSVLGSEASQRDAAMLAAGWRRRFVATRARAEEMREQYEAMGFSVELCDVAPELLNEGNPDERCAGCCDALDQDVVVYTKTT